LTDHSPYGLRHGFAMRLLERGVGIKAIGDLLGHRTFESTAVYLRLNTEALRMSPYKCRERHGGRLYEHRHSPHAFRVRSTAIHSTGIARTQPVESTP
jgi:integrase/recombinase XerD